MTREEAIKICTREKECVQAALDACADGGHYVSPDGIITAVDYVEALDMAIAALREQPKKISVKERLPDAFVDVLAYRESGRVEINYMLTTGLWRYGSVCANPVTHWMPLPEPPTKEE